MYLLSAARDDRGAEDRPVINKRVELAVFPARGPRSPKVLQKIAVVLPAGKFRFERLRVHAHYDCPEPEIDKSFGKLCRRSSS